jgi:hypothetical protein
VFNEIGTISSIFKDRFALDSTNDDMMQCSRGLPAIASRSGEAGWRLCGLYAAWHLQIKAHPFVNMKI